MVYKSVTGYNVEYPYETAARVVRGFTYEFPKEDELRYFVSSTKRILEAFMYAESLVIALREENRILKEQNDFLDRYIQETSNKDTL